MKNKSIEEEKEDVMLPLNSNPEKENLEYLNNIDPDPSKWVCLSCPGEWLVFFSWCCVWWHWFNCTGFHHNTKKKINPKQLSNTILFAFLFSPGVASFRAQMAEIAMGNECFLNCPLCPSFGESTRRFNPIRYDLLNVVLTLMIVIIRPPPTKPASTGRRDFYVHNA